MRKRSFFQPGITAESRMITPEQFVTGIAKAPLVHEPVRHGSTHVRRCARTVVEAISGQRLRCFSMTPVPASQYGRQQAFKVPEPQWSRIAEPLPKNPSQAAPTTSCRHEIEPLE